MIRNRKRARLALILAAVALAAGAQIQAQQTNPPASTGPVAPATTATTTDELEEDDEIVQLTPFEVSAGSEQGYNAAQTLAGNRLNTDLRDIGNAVSVVTSQFLRDTGAVDNKTLLQYLPSGEVGSVYGNFAGTGDGSTPDETGRFTNPNQNTRVRGLTSADNTRDFFLTDIPWDGYNVDRVDFQRGPNSILFGQGSPAGIINAGTKQAGFKNAGELELRFGSYGSTRQSLNYNRVLIPNELAIRIALLRNDEQYQQEPAFTLDKRLFSALRYEPGFLKKGSARTVLRANIEFGDIDSNTPRTLPPFDLITPWFYTGTYQTGWLNGAGQPQTLNNLNRSTYNPSQMQDDNTALPNHGQMRPSINGGNVVSLPSGSFNPAYNPWISNFGQQFGSPMLIFNGDSSAIQQAMLFENASYWAIDSAGVRDGGVLPFHRPGGVSPYSAFARQARLEWWRQGIYKDKSLTDASVFDFYNSMLDGPNKSEWQNFRTYNVSLAQTFLNDQIGFEAVLNNEWWKGGQKGLFSSWRQSLGIDITRNFLNNGSPDVGLVNPTADPASPNFRPIVEPWGNGMPNPNVGRPYVTDSAQGTNNERVTDRESGRITGFVRHDFTRDEWMPSTVGKILGSHTITGLYATDERNDQNRNWQRYGTDGAHRAFLGLNPDNNQYTTVFNANERTPNPVIYLGPSLASRSTAAGANIPRPMEVIQVPKTVNLMVFDSHWNRPTDPSAPGYVDPAAPWENGYYPADQTPRVSTQSENPANYVGWVTKPFNIINADDSQASREALTTSATLNRNEVKSKALVWQGHLWNKLLVGTAGVRKDTAKGWSSSQDVNTQPNTGAFSQSDRNLNFGDAWRIYGDPKNAGPAANSGILAGTPTAITVTSKSYSVVAHLSQLFPGRLPVDFSLFWAKSTNFQPFSNRVDLYGVAIGAPEGKTEERGIMISTRDNKYSLKLNKYKTESINQNSGALGGTWFIGASQAWSANWVNRFEYNWTADTNAGAVANPDPTNSMYNYAPAAGETQEQAAAREAQVIASWRAWQKSVDPRFYTAWNINLNDPTRSVAASNPAGFSVTEDSISKGYEVEFNANPTRNWRISVNASKTNAARVNIGGAALSDFIGKYTAALNNGAPGSVGDLRIWWGGAGNETALLQWNSNIGSEYAQRKLQEGTNVPELREWRANVVTNYDFDHSWLKGFSVGGGLRWQSDIIIGYRPVWVDPAKTQVTYDMANPYKGPTETAIDLWTSYRRKLTDRVEWVVQLNIRNLNHGGDALIPITVQPDGSPAGYRIRPPRTWQLTNTFRF